MFSGELDLHNCFRAADPFTRSGIRLLAMYAVVPTCLGMGVNCAVVTYDQKMFVSFPAIALAAGDAVEKSMEYFDQKFKELRHAAEVRE